MVIATGRSTRQVGAMAEHLAEKLKAAGGTVEVVEPPGGAKRPPARGNALTNR